MTHSLKLIFVLSAMVAITGCSRDWETFRHDVFGTAHQPNRSDLGDPSKVPNLSVQWSWQMPAVAPQTGANSQRINARSFRGSPVVDDDRVYIGGGDGIFRAFDANTGALLWQFPTPAQIASGTQPPLLSQFACNPSSKGIASSAAMTRMGSTKAVVFGAPDPTSGAGNGDGRLFMLNAATGAEIWRSDVVAVVNGLTWYDVSERHEQIGYAAPLVFNDRVYVGIANHCDNPIQQGQVRAVELSSGALVAGFEFVGAEGPGGARRLGGGVWTHVATDIDSVYTTTGNIASANATEPPVNNALAMVRLDKNSGALQGKIQPVPFSMDGDPDWSAGPAVMPSTGCGLLVASTMKDGWTYAAEPDGAGFPLRWQFPPTGYPFTPGDGTGTLHGDVRFLRPGAAWGGVFVTMAGGLSTTNFATRSDNFGRLHALNVCSDNSDRIRWIKDVPGTPAGSSYRLGPPTITRGIVYVGTTNGVLVAIADPSKAPPVGYRCGHPDIDFADCVTNGFNLVPDPAVLVSVQLQGRILTEPALSRGRVFVATDEGWLYMLEP